MTHDEIIEEIAAWWHRGRFQWAHVEAFGETLGRDAYGTMFAVVDSRAKDDCITLLFDESSSLTLWQPAGLTVTLDELILERADRVRFECYHDGVKEGAKVLSWIEYAIKDDHLVRYVRDASFGMQRTDQRLRGPFDAALVARWFSDG